MAENVTGLEKRIESGDQILVAEMSPPKGSDPAALLAAAELYAGKVHAVGVNDNRDGARMSALAAASLLAKKGVEPILHVITRDRNRIALVSDCLGAQALGVGNLLCTTGTHQSLGHARTARNVFDVDSVQLLSLFANLSSNGSAVGEEAMQAAGPLCLGAVASPYADPMEMQILKLSKKISAGARFLITQPVFDIERFQVFWREVTGRGMQQKAAFLAGIRLLGDAESATAYAEGRPRPAIPKALLERVVSQPDPAAQRAASIEIALETIQHLSGLGGLRGFEICADGDDRAALQVIQKSGLRVE